MKRILVILTLCLLQSACLSWRPILERHGEVKSALSEKLTLEQVRDTIMDAARSPNLGGGWSVKELEPGKLAAAITVRGTYHVAVNIYYTTHDFRITYRDSDHMYKAGPLIHRKYNAWVKRLKQQIEKKLYEI